MKLPSGQQPPTPPAQPATQTSRPSVTTESAREPLPASARHLLDQLQLKNRETTLARVAEIINRQGGNSADLLLDIRGKSLLVQAAVGKTELATGDWMKVMRAGNELQLMGKLAPAPEAGIARALAQRLPWQQTLDTGLARLLGTLTQGVRQEPLPGQLPSSQSPQPLPSSARQAIEKIVARLPSGNSLAPGAGNQETTPQQVRQWLSESGLFAESRLAQTPSAQLPDLKLALGRVISALLAHQGSTPEHFNRLTAINAGTHAGTLAVSPTPRHNPAPR